MTISTRSIDETLSGNSEGNSSTDSSSVTNSIALENASESVDSQHKMHGKFHQTRMFHSNVLLIGLGVIMMTAHFGLAIAWLFCGYIIRNTISNIILLFGLDLFIISVGILGIFASKSKKHESSKRRNENLVGALHWMACMFGLTVGCFVLLSQSCVEFSQTPLYQNLFAKLLNYYNNYQNVDVPFVKPPFEGSEMEIETQQNMIIYTNPIIGIIFFCLLLSLTIFTTIASYRSFMKKNHNYLFPKDVI